MNKEDDKLYSDIFGDEDEASQPAPTPAAPVKVTPAVARPVTKNAVEVLVTSPEPMAEDDANEAARLFQEMMADTRKASAAAKKAQPPPPPPPEPLLVRQAAVVTEEEPKVRFADSVAPWTLFKGVCTLAMLVYVVGFHGRLLQDAWPALAVITAVLTCAVLIVDYLRAAAGNAAQEPKKKRGA